MLLDFIVFNIFSIIFHIVAVVFSNVSIIGEHYWTTYIMT